MPRPVEGAARLDGKFCVVTGASRCVCVCMYVCFCVHVCMYVSLYLCEFSVFGEEREVDGKLCVVTVASGCVCVCVCMCACMYVSLYSCELMQYAHTYIHTCMCFVHENA